MKMKVFSKVCAMVALVALVALVIWFSFLPVSSSLRTVLPAIVLAVSAALVCLRGSFSSDKENRAQWRALGIICFCIVVVCAVLPSFFDRQTHELIHTLDPIGVTVLCTGLGVLAVAGPIMILLVPHNDQLQYEVDAANEVIETQQERISALQRLEEEYNNSTLSNNQAIAVEKARADSAEQEKICIAQAKERLSQDLVSKQNEIDVLLEQMALAESAKERAEDERNVAFAKIKNLEDEDKRLSAVQPAADSVVMQSAEFDEIQEEVANLRGRFSALQEDLKQALEAAEISLGQISSLTTENSDLRDRVKDIGRIAFVRYEEYVGDIWSSASIYIVEPQDEDFCIGVYAVKNEKVVKSFARIIPAGQLMSPESFDNVHLDPDVTLQITPHVNLKLSAKAVERLGFSDKEIPQYAAG